jgi:hypothetical protein
LSDWSGDASFGGVAGADAICNSDANRPDTGVSYKALIGVSGVRDLSNDWPLAPDTIYNRADGMTEIGTTDSSGKLVFSLTNSIDDLGNEVWTGLSSSFTVSGNCSNFTTSDGTGNVGVASYTSTSAITRYSQWCNRTNVKLYCVESN